MQINKSIHSFILYNYVSFSLHFAFHLCLFLGGRWGILEAQHWLGHSTVLWSAGLPHKAPSGCYVDGPVGLATSQPGSHSTLWFSRYNCRERERGTAGRDGWEWDRVLRGCNVVYEYSIYNLADLTLAHKDVLRSYNQFSHNNLLKTS